jgi:LacI family transcriptional regulator
MAPGRVGRPQREDAATINDVARHAGVAPSTVSYVLSGKRTISADTRERVLASIQALGYHPHAGARALASNRANVIALVLPLRTGMHLPILMQFASSVVTTARSHDHDVLLVTADEGRAGLLRIAASAMVDGIILMDVELHDRRVALLRELDRPSVLIGFPADAVGLTCVDLDFHRAGGDCLTHLADLGHTEVALIGPPQAVYERGTGFAARTLAGFYDAAARRQVNVTSLAGEDGRAAIRDSVAKLLADRPALTGIVVHNEAAVGHLIEVLRLAGRRVPEDISVLAICPDEVAERATPAVSSVLIPAEDVGAQAVTHLMHKLSGGVVPDATLLAPRLTVRASTAPPPGA